MRVAVILTGHMRCWKEVFPNFKQRVIDRYNPDIFIHTWDDEAYWIPGDKPSNTGVFDGAPKIVDQDVIDTYKPLYYVKENWEDFNAHFEHCGKYFTNFAHRPKNILSMFYKIYQGFSLLEKHVAQLQANYDLVIRMRPDMIFHEDLPDFKPGTFYTLAHRNHLGQGTGDMIQVGSLGQMLFFTKVICFITEIYKQTNILCPHIISEQYIRNLNLNWSEFAINKTLMHTPKGNYVEAEETNAK